jgi:hypothetical protein
LSFASSAFIACVRSFSQLISLRKGNFRALIIFKNRLGMAERLLITRISCAVLSKLVSSMISLRTPHFSRTILDSKSWILFQASGEFLYLPGATWLLLRVFRVHGR